MGESKKYKRCAGCKKVKHISHFGVNNHMKDGLHYICKPCARARTAAWRGANSAAAAEYARQYRQAQRGSEGDHHKINGVPRPRRGQS